MLQKRHFVVRLRMRVAPLVVATAGLGMIGTSWSQAPPSEKGEVTGAGKFVPTGKTAVAEEDRTEAEKALLRTLKIERDGPDLLRIGLVTLDKRRRTISLPATLNQREGIIEYALVHENGKVHEALLRTKASPRDLHVALLLLGAKPVPPDGQAKVIIRVSWETNGPAVTRPLEQLVELAPDPGTAGEVMPAGPWRFSGSVFTAAGYLAESEGSHISLIADPAAILNNPGKSRDRDDLHRPHAATLPPAEQPLTVTLHLSEPTP